jgi:hypothetical protein
MSSVALKISSLVIRTLSKPIAVRATPWSQSASAYLTISRIKLKLKQNNMNGSVEYASRSLKDSTR